MLYPLTPCGTYSLVGIRNIVLQNIRIHNSVLPPGVIRCDPEFPCTGMVFDNVVADGWWQHIKASYYIENVFGVVQNSSPSPAFITNEGDGFVYSNRAEIRVQDLVEDLVDLVKGIFGTG